MVNSILIVEDDEILADNVQTYLKRNDWDVHVAATAEDALKTLEGMRPDIVLTDYLLPGKTGLDLIKGIVALDPQIKVIMITAFANLDTAIEALRGDVHDFFPKPVKIKELKASIRKALTIPA